MPPRAGDDERRAREGEDGCGRIFFVALIVSTRCRRVASRARARRTSRLARAARVGYPIHPWDSGCRGVKLGFLTVCPGGDGWGTQGAAALVCRRGRRVADRGRRRIAHDWNRATANHVSSTDRCFSPLYLFPPRAGCSRPSPSCRRSPMPKSPSKSNTC